MKYLISKSNLYHLKELEKGGKTFQTVSRYDITRVVGLQRNLSAPRGILFLNNNNSSNLCLQSLSPKSKLQRLNIESIIRALSAWNNHRGPRSKAASWHLHQIENDPHQNRQIFPPGNTNLSRQKSYHFRFPRSLIQKRYF